MYSRYLAVIALCAVMLAGFVPMVLAQDGQAQGNRTERLEVMRSKLESMRRQLNNAIANVNTKEGSDPQKSKDSPEAEAASRLRGLEREVNSVLSDVLAIRAKIDKSERYEVKDIEKLEVSTADISTRVEAGLIATAGVRKADSGVAQKKKKKKGRFFGLFGGGGSGDKYEELTGTVAPGRDRELFELAAKEVRNGNYESGRLLFNTIITTYPF